MDTIYALEHRTMSRSPIENAIAVADRLPAGANLLPGVALARWDDWRSAVPSGD